jgi:hypothetical protein
VQADGVPFSTFACVYVYIYIHTHKYTSYIYTYIHTYIYTQVDGAAFSTFNLAGNVYTQVSYIYIYMYTYICIRTQDLSLQETYLHRRVYKERVIYKRVFIFVHVEDTNTHTAIPVIIEDRFQVFQRFSSSKPVLKNR